MQKLPSSQKYLAILGQIPNFICYSMQARYPLPVFM